MGPLMLLVFRLCFRREGGGVYDQAIEELDQKASSSSSSRPISLSNNRAAAGFARQAGRYSSIALGAFGEVFPNVTSCFNPETAEAGILRYALLALHP
jgi:hypothetical protein